MKTFIKYFTLFTITFLLINDYVSVRVVSYEDQLKQLEIKKYDANGKLFRHFVPSDLNGSGESTEFYPTGEMKLIIPMVN